MRLSRRILACLMAALLMATQAGVRTATEPQVASEYTVKAAFLFNVLNFVQWPPTALPPAAPVTILVVSAAPLPEFVKALDGRTIEGHLLRVQVYRGGDVATGVQVIFVGSDSLSAAATIVRSARGLPVLSVADGRMPATATPTVELATANARLVFDVDLDAADAAGLQISAKLLGLARRVHTTRPSPATAR